MINLHIPLLFFFGFFGGFLAFNIGAPMPFMLGGIAGAASFIIWFERDGRQLPKLSRWVRLVFMSIIGTMLGSKVSPEFLPLLPQFWPSALALVPFILLSHGGGYAMMRFWGGYEKKDAYYAALPGGIVDTAALAEEAGADLRVVTAQHFIRIILVVTSVPLLFLFVTGEAVGSLAGESISSGEIYNFSDLAIIVIIAFIGLLLGRVTRLPVSHMLGPLFLSITLTVTGVIKIDFPWWLSHLAQYMVGTALGAQFSGISRKMLARGLRMGLLAGIYMLMLALCFAFFLSTYVPAEFNVLFVSFAVGGLAEMSLVALSLNYNPVIVAIHHLARIVLTVMCAHLLARRLS